MRRRTFEHSVDPPRAGAGGKLQLTMQNKARLFVGSKS